MLPEPSRLDGERARHVANIDLARAIAHAHISAYVLDLEIARAIGDADRAAAPIHRKVAGSIAGFERADVQNFRVAAAIRTSALMPCGTWITRSSAAELSSMSGSNLVGDVCLDEHDIAPPLGDQLDLD